MSRPRKSAHLILRKDRYDKSGRLTHNAVYLIKDGDLKISTGCGRDDLVGAEKQLNDYLTKKHAHEVLKGAPQKLQAHEVPVADVINHYIADVGPRFENKPKQKRDFVKRMEALHQNALQNEIEVDAIDAAELRRREPEVAGLGALFVPETGIVDYRQICEAMGRVIERDGGEIEFGQRVDAILEGDVITRVELVGR